MANIIVAFPKTEDAKSIRNLLTRSGFRVTAVCTTGAQVLNHANSLNDGILVCGCRFADMEYRELRSYLPAWFQMLLLAPGSYGVEEETENLVCVSLPLKLHDLLDTLSMMEAAILQKKRKSKAAPRRRSEEETAVIEKAKEILMERNHMTEREAHRYIQKCSMDSGTNLVETAQMVIRIMMQ